jgi:tetratricopeptide (TPR) repeat protein
MPDRSSDVPRALKAQLAQVQALLEGGRAADALVELDALLGTAPAHAAPVHADLLRLRALALFAQGRLSDAIEAYRAAARLAPRDALILCQLGAALAQSGDLDAAERALLDATALDPRLTDAWYNLGHVYDARADTTSASEAFARVLAIDARHVAARVQYAESLKMLGRLAQAEQELRAVLAQDPDSISAWVGLSNLKTFRPSADELEGLLRLQASDKVPAQRRADLAFACASLLEAGGRYKEAFALFMQANGAKRRQVRWNAAAVSGLVDAILDRFAQLPPPRDDPRGSEAIFLVGMPRSGSTLAEQILSAHPHVQGGGERNEIVQVLQTESQRRARAFPEWVTDADDNDWARLGEEYLERCRAWRDTRAHFSNKTLTNWQTLGAIRRMLPRAHIVHCRRDPLETLWSCYKHHFGEAQFFTYDLDELVAFWRDCERSMRAWSQAWPDWIHVFEHERLLAQPEASIRALLDACDLRFDAACLAFHENRRDVRTSSASQVRQPLRRDLAVTQYYGVLLDSLRRSIESHA